MSADGDRSGSGAVARRIIAIASRLVPRSARTRWRREWEAELWHREQALLRSGASAPRLLARLIGPALGGLVHALWHRVRSPGLDGLRQDASSALRALTRSPLFSVAAALTLGFGFAVSVAVFAVVRGALWVSYPYASPEQLVAIVGRDLERPGESLPLAYAEVEALAATGVMEAVAAYDWDPFNVRLSDRTEWVGGGVVGPAFFTMLGVTPVAGRFFLDGEDRAGAGPVVVLGEQLWRTAFGARDVVGEALWLDGTPYQVVGVAPEFVDLPEGAELWVPLRPPGEGSPSADRTVRALGRLAPGAARARAQTALEAVSAGLTSASPEFGADRGLEAVPLREHRIGGLRRALLALPFAAGLLLLAACANLAGLFLARSASRHAEFVVRRALGASGVRLARQLVTESLLIAAAGGAIGLTLGWWGIAALVRLVPERPVWFDPVLDGPTILMVGLLTVSSAVVFGAAQVSSTSERRLYAPAGGRASRADRSRSALIFAEVALSTVLLVGSVLLVRSLLAISAVDPGFDSQDRVAGTLQLAASQYARDEQVIGFATRLIESLEARPDVASAAIVTRVPFRGGVNPVRWRDDLQAETAYEENPAAELNSVSAGYFATMGISLRSGRAFTVSDRTGPPVVVIGEKLAREHFGGRDPIGRRITVGYAPRFFEVIGVVEDVKPVGLDREPEFQIYALHAQRPTQRFTVVVRLRAGAPTIASGLRAIVRDMDPDLAISDLSRLDTSVRQSFWRLRLLTHASWAGGLFAVLLAAVGSFGIVAQAVTRRTKEIGIRMALGAPSTRIARLVAVHTGRVVGAGLLTGVAAAFAATRFVRGLLYGVHPGDPFTYASVLAGFAVVAALATWLPARRAVSVDPVRALRSE